MFTLLCCSPAGPPAVLRCLLRTLWLTVLVLPGLVDAGAAQHVRALDGATEAQQTTPPIDAVPVHATDLLMDRPEGRAAMEEFHYLKETGQLEARVAPAPASYEVGERRTFKTFNFVDSEREEITFQLRLIGDTVRIWTEADAPLQPAIGTALQTIRRALEDATPNASINPSHGILDNSRALIGQPPNVDGDGVLDVLLLDIRDNFDAATNPRFIAGFVDPADLTDRGNARDIIYLDDRPLRVRQETTRTLEDVLSTAAHEYQHLIHLNYDRRELTFVNEGLSEWNEVLNGYRPRRMVYLGEAEQMDVPLLRWSGRGSESVLFDYQRAGLLTTYLARRLGPFETGAIARDPARGVDGYRNAALAAGDSWRDLLLDFHTANKLNPTTPDGRFSYDDPRFLTIGALGATVTDGRLAQGREGRIRLQPGGVRYLRWRHVQDVEITLEGPHALDARLITTSDGITTDRRLHPSQPTTLTGSYETVVLVAAHTDTDAAPFTAFYHARWRSDDLFAADSVQFDNGVPDAFIRVQRNHGAGREVLTELRNPMPGTAFLGTIDLPLYFSSQFSNEDAPPLETDRPYTLVLRDVAPDGTPGDVLFTRSATDTRGAVPASGRQLRRLTMDLTSDRATMEALPERFFVGFRDAPETPNPVVYPTSIDSTQNRSYVGQPGEWATLWDTRIPRGGGEDSSPLSLEGTFMPVRAAFFRPTDDVPVLRDEALPERPALLANAPNPFQQSTQLRYELPADGPIRLAVYDVQGREIALLRDEVQTAGPHTLSIDARGWASGVYIVQLRAAGHTTDLPIVHVR